jgi:precorrin-3B synthase
MPAGDGLLVRVRLPGGRLTAAQLLGCADLTERTGQPLELTSRANLQLRGLDAPGAARAAEVLVGLGLVAEPPAVDAHRNVLASPTAGLDADEVLDVGPLVHEVASRLAATPDLHPKFGVLLDGGGSVHLRERRHPLALGAVTAADGQVWFQASVGRPLGLDVPSDAVLVPGSLVLDVVQTVAATEVRHPDEVLALRGVTTAGEVGVRARWAPSLLPAGVSGSWVGAMPWLGRMTAAQARAVAALVHDEGAELRTTPWRSLLVAGVQRRRASVVAEAVGAAGLAVDPAHPAWTVSACAGSTGCTAAAADTLADGRSVVEALAPRSAWGGGLHLVGCAKGCGRQAAHHVLVAGDDGRYRTEERS